MANSEDEFDMALFVLQLQLSIHIQPMLVLSTYGADGKHVWCGWHVKF